MAFNKVFEYTAAVRGFHYFKTFWQPKEKELLSCHFENGNNYDMFAIKTCDEEGRMVGHLPREVSRITKFIIDRGAKVTVELLGTHYRRSPLVKGGLEIPCKVSVSMSGTCVNLLLLERYKQLTEELYLEPKEEIVLGSFLVPIQTPQIQDRVQRKRSQKKPENAGKPTTTSRDIRQYFRDRQVVEENKSEQEKSDSLIVID